MSIQKDASEYSTEQIMMTLAQLSALSATARPSGETIEQQAQRILAGINATLANTNLATGGDWSAVWLALTPDGGNVVYLATCSSMNSIAVCVRGTQFSSLVDLGEDMAVSEVAQLTPGSSALLVSKGAMKAFTDTTGATGVVSPDSNLTPGNLLQTLTALLAEASAQPTIYVTGHSLGGAIATMIALYLAELAAQQTWANTPAIVAYTFAAPTAGLSSFATAYDTIMGTAPNQAYRYYNQYDAVPYAWADLSYVQDISNFYPGQTAPTPPGPGPLQDTDVTIMLGTVAKMPGNNEYVQTNGNSPDGSNTIALNSDYGIYDPSCVHTTTADFLGQIAFQHNCYLQLLGAPPLPTTGQPGAAPQVLLVSPNYGPTAGGTKVTITGVGFTSDCVVDFGNVAAEDIVIVSQIEIQATQPAGIGTVDVRVTNMFGTSAVTSIDQFAAPMPAGPTVTSVSPTVVANNISSYLITVTGTGFVKYPGTHYIVNFGDELEQDVTVSSMTELTVNPPTSGSGAVDVRVIVARDTIPPGIQAESPVLQPSDWYPLGAPIVSGVSPSSGSEGGGQTVTITGFGFSQGCTISFGGSNAKSVTVNSDTQITVTSPLVGVSNGLYNTVDVTVTNLSGQTSEVTPNDEYIYYKTPKS